MESKLYYRRCHRCDGLNEAPDNEMSRCRCCEKPLAPFYYFDEKAVVALTDTGHSGESPIASKEYYRPLMGFSAYW